MIAYLKIGGNFFCFLFGRSVDAGETAEFTVFLTESDDIFACVAVAVVIEHCESFSLFYGEVLRLRAFKFSK